MHHPWRTPSSDQRGNQKTKRNGHGSLARDTGPRSGWYHEKCYREISRTPFAGQLGDGGGEGGAFAVLVDGFHFEFDVFPALLLVLAGDAAVDVERVAFAVVAGGFAIKIVVQVCVPG